MSEVISIRLSDEELAVVDKIATKKGVSRSDILRESILSICGTDIDFVGNEIWQRERDSVQLPLIEANISLKKSIGEIDEATRKLALISGPSLIRVTAIVFEELRVAKKCATQIREECIPKAFKTMERAIPEKDIISVIGDTQTIKNRFLDKLKRKQK